MLNPQQAENAHKDTVCLHLEIDPHIDTMTWGPGTLVVSNHASEVTHTHCWRSTVHSLSASATAAARRSGLSGRFRVPVVSPLFIHGLFFCNYTP